MIEYLAILHCEQEQCLNGDRGPIADIAKMKEAARNRGWVIDSVQCRCAKHLIGKEKPKPERRIYSRRDIREIGRRTDICSRRNSSPGGRRSDD